MEIKEALEILKYYDKQPYFFSKDASADIAFKMAIEALGTLEKVQEVILEVKECYNKCNELFDIAYNLNNNENTRTAFSQKVTTYMPDIMQTIGFIIGELEGEK